MVIIRSVPQQTAQSTRPNNSHKWNEMDTNNSTSVIVDVNQQFLPRLKQPKLLQSRRERSIEI